MGGWLGRGFLWWLGGCLMGWVTGFFCGWMGVWLIDRSFWLFGGIGGFMMAGWVVGCVGGFCGGWVGEDEYLFCLRGVFWWLDAFLGFRFQFFGRGGVFGRGFGIFDFLIRLGGFSDRGFIIMN